MAWSQRIGGADVIPEIFSEGLEVGFGSVHFSIEELPGQPCVRVTVLRPEGARVVLQRLEEMVREVKRECMPQLEFFAALPVPQLDDAELDAAARAAGACHLVPASRVRAAHRCRENHRVGR